VIFKSKNVCYFAGLLLRMMKRLHEEGSLEDRFMNVSLFMGTWNVGNTPPVVDNFEPWIPKNKYDLYVIGVQECQYDQRHPYTTCDEDWFTSLSNHIGDEYEVLEATSMWQIRSAVYVRKSLSKTISTLDKSREPTGIGSVMGNKGAVVICFNLFETSFCFVNSHLAAHQENIKDRNEDVQEVIDNIKLTDGSDKIKDISTQFEHVFWCGDLNYRIDLSRDEVIEKVNQKNLEALRLHDQLIEERQKGTVFSNFSEGQILFTPTYKFDNNKPHTEYSTSRNRVPAWCDRILWSSWDGSTGSIEQKEYNCSHEIITSDHSPVYSVFQVKVEKPWIPHHFPEGELSIVFYNLSGETLRACDMNGFSDPFLRIFAPFLLRREKTQVIKKNLNPIWEGEVIILIPLILSTEYLKYKSINIEARDQDLVGNDLIGRGTLALNGKLDGEEHGFEITIWKHGVFSGKIKGNIKLLFHHENDK